MKCLECQTELTQTLGKREKKFCNSTCRSNYWQKQQVLSKKEVKVTDLNIPTNMVEPQKPLGSKKTNTVFDTTNEPKENSMAFFNKYGVNTWTEVETKKEK